MVFGKAVKTVRNDEFIKLNCFNRKRSFYTPYLRVYILELLELTGVCGYHIGQ